MPKLTKLDKINLTIFGVGLIGTVFVVWVNQKSEELELETLNKIAALWVSTDVFMEKIQDGTYHPGNVDKMESDFEYYVKHNKFPEEN